MKQMLSIGAYTTYPPANGEDPHGITVCQMDADTGHLDILQHVDGGPNPSFLTLSADGRRLYAVNELPEGMVSAFAVDDETGTLTFLNRQIVEGADPCYASLDPGGRWLLASCYSSGNLTVLPITENGWIGSIAEHIQHEGSGPDQKRQEKAHVHCARFDPQGEFVLVADLGMDRVWVYRMVSETGKLIPNEPPGLEMIPGSGPRHLEYHPNGRFVYISNELGSTVTACEWDVQTGILTPLQTRSTLSGTHPVDNAVADIHITPDGNYLYVSNRGEDSLAAYKVNAGDGTLDWIGNFSCGGRWPRNFAIAPGGNFLLVANQFSGNVCVFRIGSDGSLLETGEVLQTPAPVCIRFA